MTIAPKMCPATRLPCGRSDCHYGCSRPPLAVDNSVPTPWNSAGECSHGTPLSHNCSFCGPRKQP